MSDQAKKSPAEQVRQDLMEVATEHFIQSLKSLGVETFVVGFAISETQGGQGFFRRAGRTALILNLLAGLTDSLTPDDFRMFLRMLNESADFAKHRGDKSHAEDAKLPMPGKWMN